jgi:hypothetical protein
MLREPIQWPRIAATLAFAMTAVAPAAAQTPTQVDSVRLMADLAVLAHDSMEGRGTGTQGSQRARRFLEGRMQEVGVQPLESGYGQPFSWPRGMGENVVGIVPGLNPEGEVIVVTAHYDHVGVLDGRIFNGADDNASGAAAVLEIARQLVAMPLDHSVVLALLDAEEVGSWGARALLDHPPMSADRIALNVNLDMVARTGGVLWAAGAYHTPVLRPILEGVAAAAPLTLRLGHDRPEAPEGDDWTASSDHSTFHDAGIPFVYLGVEDHEDYHQPTDDFERVDPGEYMASVRTILMVLRALDQALPPAPAEP